MAKDRMFLYGKNPVFERLASNPKSIRKIMLREDFDDPKMLGMINSSAIQVERIEKKEFAKLKHADRVQGVIAVVDKFEYAHLQDLLDMPKERRLTLVFLDRLSDPQNLGVILRSTACFGGFALVLPKHESCEITDTVLHVASGGENFVPVSIVTNLATALIQAKTAGYWAAGTVVEGGEDIGRVKFPFPLCLVMGSEGEGIRPGLMNHLDIKVTLPMRGAGLSFNVAVATALFCYEITRQRTKQ